MESWRSVLLISFLLFLIHSFSVSALYCAQCSYRDPGCRHGNIRATRCSEPATHCFIYRLYLDPRGRGTFRGCINEVRDEPACKQLTIDGVSGVACTEVCDHSGCNSNVGLARYGRSIGRR